MPRPPSESAARAPRGRPRSEQARRAILTAALELLRDAGYPAVTVDAVAKRAGVARTTIYRWWPSSGALLIDVLMEISTTVAPLPVGTDPLRAIRLEMRRIAAISSELPGLVLRALLAEAQHDPQIHSALLERLIYPRREASSRAIRDAQARGLLRDDVHPYVVVDLFYGPIFYRLLMGHEPPTERFVAQIFERVVGGMASSKEPEKRSRT